MYDKLFLKALEINKSCEGLIAEACELSEHDCEHCFNKRTCKLLQETAKIVMKKYI